MKPNFLTVNPEDNIEILKGLASPVRVSILKLLHVKGPLNVNDISRFLALPQSTVATNVQVLEEAGLIDTDTVKAKKGHQKILKAGVDSLEFSMELSSEVPGTNPDWPSDITLWVNSTPVGTWTSPGDFGDKRGVYTPNWWKLEGSQYGKLKTWRVATDGTFID